MAERPFAIRQELDGAGKRLFREWKKYRFALLLRLCQSIRQLAKRLRGRTRRKMIGVVLRFILLVQGGDCVGNEIDVHNINPIARAKRQNGQTREKNESFNHVELGGGCMAAI